MLSFLRTVCTHNYVAGGGGGGEHCSAINCVFFVKPRLLENECLYKGS